MNELLFKIFVIVMSLILLAVVIITIAEIVAHRKDEDNKRFKRKLEHMRPYKDGYAFADNADLSKAMQIMYITSERIEFSDTGMNGKYHTIWEW